MKYNETSRKFIKEEREREEKKIIIYIDIYFLCNKL